MHGVWTKLPPTQKKEEQGRGLLLFFRPLPHNRKRKGLSFFLLPPVSHPQPPRLLLLLLLLLSLLPPEAVSSSRKRISHQRKRVFFPLDSPQTLPPPKPQKGGEEQLISIGNASFLSSSSFLFPLVLPSQSLRQFLKKNLPFFGRGGGDGTEKARLPWDEDFFSFFSSKK